MRRRRLALALALYAAPGLVLYTLHPPRAGLPLSDFAAEAVRCAILWPRLLVPDPVDGRFRP